MTKKGSIIKFLEKFPFKKCSQAKFFIKQVTLA